MVCSFDSCDVACSESSAPISLNRGSQQPGADPEILKRGGALCQPPWLAGEEKFRFQMA